MDMTKWETGDHWLHVQLALDGRHLTDFLSDAARKSIERGLAEALAYTEGKPYLNVLWDALEAHPLASILSDPWKHRATSAIADRYAGLAER